MKKLDSKYLLISIFCCTLKIFFKKKMSLLKIDGLCTTP